MAPGSGGGDRKGRGRFRGFEVGKDEGRKDASKKVVGDDNGKRRKWKMRKRGQRVGGGGGGIRAV